MKPCHLFFRAQCAKRSRTEGKPFFPASVLLAIIAATVSGCGGGENQDNGKVYTIDGDGLTTSASTSGVGYNATVEGSWSERTTESIQNNTITISATERTAGAISSIKWRGKEFINNYDHGRQMQYAWQYGDYGECANPTEAGSYADGIGSRSSSTLKSISVVNKSLHTITAPASWLNCGPSVSSDLVEKTVTIENGLIKSVAKVAARALALPIRIEAPTIYIPPDFNQFHTTEGVASQANCIDVHYNAWLWENMQGCEILEPIIAATQGGAFAIGMYTVPTDDTLTYAFYHLSTHNADAPNASRTKKIGANVWSKNNSSQIEIISYIAVGDLATVRKAIARLKNNTDWTAPNTERP